MAPDHSASSRIVLAFHERWWQDHAEGRERALGEYLALWPGHEAAIAREFLSLRQEDAGGAGMDETPPPAPGRNRLRLGPFRILEELGRGGQGVVYKAHDERLGRTVALKLLHATADPTGAAFLRFQREATVASKLEHPGICAVLEAGREGTTAWIAMRFVEGESLAQRIAIRRELALGDATQTLPDQDHGSGSGSGTATLDPTTEVWRRPPKASAGTPSSASTRDEIQEIARFLAAAARAVHAAHEAGVIHRDLKPGNLMVSRGSGSDADRQVRAGEAGGSAVVRAGEHPVILDFGLARDDSAAGVTLTATGDVFGTPVYMAPEQLRQEGPPPDRRADVWALGVTLYEALTLRRPFESATHDGLVRAILGREPPDVRRLAPHISRDLAVVVATALEKDLGRRYQTAAALADDLEAALEHRPISARPVGPFGRLLRWARREPAKAAIVVLLALGIPTVAGLGATIAATRDAVRAAEDAEARRGIEQLLEEGFLDADKPDPRPALERFDEVLRRDPGNMEALLGRVMALKMAGRFQEALDTMGLPDMPDGLPPALLRVRAGLLRQSGREEEAARVAAGFAVPETAEDLFVAGMDHLADVSTKGRPAAAEALKLFSASILRAPAARPLYYFQAAAAAALAGDAASGNELVAAIRLLWGGSSRAHIACAFVKQLAMKDAEALAEYAEALRLDPASRRGLIGSADIELRNGRTEAALVLYRKALALAPGNLASTSGIAECLIRLERFDEARLTIDEALRVSPDEPTLVHSSGHLAAMMGDHERAMTLYRRAARLRAGFSAAHTNLGNSLMHVGRPDDAEIEYRKAIGFNPLEVPSRLALGLILGQKGENAAALEEFLAADRLQPGNPGILYNVGLAHLLCGDPGAAAAALRRSIEGKPDDWQAHLALARALNDSGDQDAAITAAQDAIAAGHASSGLCYLAGGWLTNAGRIEEAAAAYRESARIDPENAEAWCNLGQRLKVLGRFREALEAARRGHEIGSARPEWKHPSLIWVTACVELVAAEAGLDAALAGDGPAPSGHEWLRMAEVSGIRKRPADEARCLEQAWKADPALAGDTSERLKLRAAEAAIRASQGGPPEDGAAWRARARSWLDEEFLRLESYFDAGRIDGEIIAGILRFWTDSEDLAAVRDARALDLLAPEEARAWIEFWKRMAALKSRSDT